MSGFSAGWLALREPFDAAARARAEPVWTALAAHRAALPGTCRVLDLGCGTGANLRATAPRLGGAQQWQLVDHDPQLLAALPAALRSWAQAHGLDAEAQGLHLRSASQGLRIEARPLRADLAADLDRLPFAHCDLVTASALIDLTSAPWLQRLVAHCRAAGAALLCALEVDGRIRWSPGDPDDDTVLALFRADQQRDKGFGPALGGRAPQALAQCLADAGYRVVRAATDWHIDGAQSMAMLHALCDGMAAAAIAQSPSQAGRVRAWQARRRAGAARSRLCIGHEDILGLP